jgi:hypothetical protein
MAPQRSPPPGGSPGGAPPRAAAALALAAALLAGGCGAAVPPTRAPAAGGPALATPADPAAPGGATRGCIRQRCGTFLCPPEEGAPGDARPIVLGVTPCPGAAAGRPSPA